MLLPRLVGACAELTATRRMIGTLLEQSRGGRLPPVLIQGETGAGKGLLARELVAASPRAAAPFVALNCAAIPETLIEAELFGFERGAFTDARHAKQGLFQAADRGTLFLDEIAALPTAMQAKLLTAVEDRSVRRIGSTRPEPVDAWIISATSVDLPTATRRGQFLDALLHRLSVVRLELPPLRERGADLLALADHFLAELCAEHRLPPRRFSDDARDALVAHSWPGNVRELRNVIERAALLHQGDEISDAMLALVRPAAPRAAAPRRTIDRPQLVEALHAAGWNLSRAAASLGIPRNTLRYRMERLELRPPAPAAPSVEKRRARRRVTFLAVAGDAEALADAAAKVELFGGRLDEHDDRLLASFGADAVEDAPRHAALCAAAVVHLESGVRAALHSADVEVVDGALDPPAGALVLAPLLASLARAAAGTVTATEAAAAELSRRFALTPAEGDSLVGPELRGFSLGGRVTPFVGRAAELDLLAGRLRAAQEGRGQAVDVVGEAGSGKCRLLFELRGRLADPGLVTIVMRCRPYGAAVPFLPLIDAVRGLCGAGESDPPAVSAEKLARTVHRLDLPADIAPYLFRLLGLGDGGERMAKAAPETTQAATSAAVRQLLLRAGGRGTLLLVLEDAHWIDRSSEAVLAGLVEQLPSARILFVASYRPTYRAPWADLSYVSRVSLAPLSPAESARIVGAVAARPLEPGLLAAVLARGEGNPFFLEELALATAGSDRPDHVPETIQRVLAVRIERLPEPARRLLATAAVLGRKLSLRLLAAVWNGPEELEPLLSLLVQKELLARDGGAGEPSLSFRHALTQEVAENGLPAGERALLHLAAGRALERLGRSDELPDLLAYHFERSPDAERAFAYLDRANARCIESSAPEAGKVYFDKALATLTGLADPGARRIALVSRQFYLFMMLLRLGDFHELLLEHEAEALLLSDLGLRGEFLSKLGYCQWAACQPAQAIDTLARAVDLCAANGRAHEAGSALLCSMWAHLLAGDFAAASRLQGPAIALLDSHRDLRSSISTHAGAAWALAELGRTDDAERQGAEAMRSARETDDASLITLAAWSLSRIAGRRGDAALARERAELALERAITPLDQMLSRFHLAWAWCLGGDAERGVAALDELNAACASVRFAALEEFRGYLGEGLVQLGEHARAEAFFRGRVGYADAHGMRFIAGHARRWLGEIALAEGRKGEARRELTESLGTLTVLGAKLELGRVRARLAELG